MNIDTLAARRNRLLVGNACGFLIWQACTFGPHLAGHGVAPLIIVFGIAGFLLWGVTLWQLLRPIPDARTRAALDDELTRHHQQRAMLAGYWAMLLTAAAALAVASFMPLASLLVLRVLIAVGVAAPLLRFVVLERAGGGE